MSLFTSTMLQEWIRDLITDVHSGIGNLQCNGGIMLVTAPDMKLSPEYLYIGDPETILEFLKQGPDILPWNLFNQCRLHLPVSGFSSRVPYYHRNQSGAPAPL